MRQRIAKISEETLMPIGLVLVLLGGVYMGAQSFKQIEANGASIKKVEDKQDKYDDAVSRIDRRLSRIEGALKIEGDDD